MHQRNNPTIMMPSASWRMESLKKFFVFLVLIISISADERLRLVKADVLENITTNGKAVQILTGNVIFTKGELTLTCDLAHYTEKTGQGFLIGNAMATKDSMTLTADTLHFDSPNDILNANGNSHAWNNEYDLTAESIIYYTKNDSGKAFGNTHLIQKGQDITANLLTYSKIEESEAANYRAYGDVVIIDDQRTITCGEANYDLENEIAILTIDPKVTSDEDVLTGDILEAHFKDEQLQYLFIPSGAKAQSVNKDATADSAKYKDNMAGNILKAYFIDGKLDSMRLEGMATTVYHVYEDSIYKGQNTASGDTVTIEFDENELQRIYVSGGARGTYTPDTTTTGLEDAIKYSANDIDYRIPDETTFLINNAQINYVNTQLTSGFISVSWATNLLDALPVAKGDTTSRTQKPTLNEGDQEPMFGDVMSYNLQTQHGKVLRGRTQVNDAFYHGAEIRNVDDKIFYINKSIYSTCDLDTPHFHFAGKQMKMIKDDKVIVKPLTLHMAQIPIISIPFAVLPAKQGGRQSGLIMPSYGNNNFRGHYLDGIGYYWAFNDYLDSKLSMSFADLQGVTFKLLTQYNNRYKYKGNLHLETRQFLSGTEQDIFKIFGPRQKDYVVKWTHQQLLRRNQSLNVNASYYSNSDYNYTTSIDPLKRMSQQAISNLTYSKRWTKSNNSISFNLSSKTDLMAGNKILTSSAFYQTPIKAGTKLNITTTTLPSISFRHGQRELFPTKSSDKSWYNNITYNYSANLNNKSQSYYESIEDTTTGEFIWDNAVENTANKILTHSFSFSAPQKVFRYITLNPSLSLKSDWVDEYYIPELDSTGIIESVKTNGFATQTTGSFQMSMSTQLYGMFPIKIGKLNGFRHVASPSISYSYTPDFSEPLFGNDLNYFTAITDASGEEIQHDKFQGTLAGSTPRTERQSLNFSLNNVFQTKLVNNESEKKLELFSWRLATNYNFAAEEFKLSNLSSSIRTKLMNILNLDISMTHDFYQYDMETKKRLNSYQLSNGIPKPRLINARFSTGFNFSGKHLKQSSETDLPAPPDTTVTDNLDDIGQNISLTQNRGKIAGGQLWSTHVSLSYAYNAANPSNSTKTFWMNTNSTIQITPKWRVQHNARFDLVNQSLVSQSFSIYRDLHCWEMSVSWTPGGYGQGIYLKINVKSPTLSDLKLEERGGIFQRVAQF